jgi:imidazolonepropionase-like amidohydrolase
MKFSLCRRILPLLALAMLPAVFPASAPVIAIRGARVIDGSGAEARVETVIVRNGRIAAVGEDLAVPEGARVIDASGDTLLPGLFDLHTHLTASAANGVPGDWGKSVRAYMACGVTTVNDFSTYGEMFAPLRQWLAAGVAPGLRVHFAARLSTPGGHGTESGWGDFMTLTAATPEEAHARMKTVLAYRPDVIKVFSDGWRYGAAPNLSSMNVETLGAMVADAHAAGIKVFTHTVTVEGDKIAARAGVDVLAHGAGDAEADEELVALLKAKGTFYVPTLAVYEPRRPESVPDRLASVVWPRVRAAMAAAAPAAISPARSKRWQIMLANVRRLCQAGVPVAVGTDAGMPGTYHGYATLHELELLVEAGLTPLEALTAATGVSARALGVDADLGRIEPGKIADLLLVSGRPDENIADIEKTHRVFLGGAQLDLKAIQGEIQSASLSTVPAHPVPTLVDDMETADGRTSLGTLRVDSTDAGVDHSTLMFLPVERAPGNHALMVEARMAPRPHPFVRVELPLSPGAVDAADLRGYRGVAFDVRGHGVFRLLLYGLGDEGADRFERPFSTSGEWETLAVPFTEIKGRKPWDPRAVRALAFELSGPAGSETWLELGNVRFYTHQVH